MLQGGLHPDATLEFYVNMVSKVKERFPGIYLHSFSPSEIVHISAKSGLSYEEIVKALKEAGLDSIPGGGAEIFDETIRREICGMKSTSAAWLEIHETAHQLGIPSNATMLYGHLENYRQRIDHLERLRQLQDRTRGFNAFIPLKFHKTNNAMADVAEVSVVEDMKMYALARIYLDNFPHLKAYWPAVGRKLAQISLSFGVDDLDGTINDSTRIYSLAGAEDQNPVMTVSQMVAMITETKRIPVERDSLYNFLP